jgi:hypothetical protein
VPNWPDHVTGDEMVAAMDKVGVDGAIFISAFSMYQYDASYAVEVQRAHPGRFAIVKPVNPDDPAVADVIADWKKTPGAVGIRVMLTKEANRAPDDPGLDRIARAAVRHDFPVNVLFWGNLDAGAALIDRHPDTRLGHGLDARVRRRQLRAGRRALPEDRPPERHRAGDADERCLRQGLRLVTEERLVLPCGSSPSPRSRGEGRGEGQAYQAEDLPRCGAGSKSALSARDRCGARSRQQNSCCGPDFAAGSLVVSNSSARSPSIATTSTSFAASGV